MLNAAIPTLQMKISGAPLSTIKTMVITIRSETLTIVKGNADIEVDNDIVSVFLTKEEADKVNNGNYNISIAAQNLNDEDVSDSLKVIMVKRGSMSKALGSGGSTDVDLSDYYTKEEVDALISSIQGETDGASPIVTVNKIGSVATITIKDKNGTTTAQISDGASGISPTITENINNTENVYKLDITNANGTFTTPNLKGKDGGNGNDLPFQIDKWYVVNTSKEFKRDGSTWNLDIPQMDVIYSLSLAAEITKDIDVYGTIYISRYAMARMRLNGVSLIDKTSTSLIHNGQHTYQLKQGLNTFEIEAWSGTSTGTASISAVIPDAIQE